SFSTARTRSSCVVSSRITISPLTSDAFTFDQRAPSHSCAERRITRVTRACRPHRPPPQIAPLTCGCDPFHEKNIADGPFGLYRIIAAFDCQAISSRWATNGGDTIFTTSPSFKPYTSSKEEDLSAWGSVT